MADLVSLENAQRHLRVVAGIADQDLDIQDKLAEATAIVIDYIERPSDEEWTETIAAWTEATVPAVVKAAILRQLAELFRFRGDDAQADTPKVEHGFLAPGVANLLHRYRDPVIA